MSDYSDSYEDAPEIETNIECPACGKMLFLTYQSKIIPYEGTIYIQTYYCKECYYKNTQISSLDEQKGKTITLNVESVEDLSSIIYRSPHGSVRIPEFELEISPGEESTGEITTVEGILTTVKDKMDMFIRDSEDRTAAEKTMKFIDDALSGKRLHMTVIVEDPTGRSIIHNSKAITREFES